MTTAIALPATAASLLGRISAAISRGHYIFREECFQCSTVTLLCGIDEGSKETTLLTLAHARLASIVDVLSRAADELARVPFRFRRCHRPKEPGERLGARGLGSADIKLVQAQRERAEVYFSESPSPSSGFLLRSKSQDNGQVRWGVPSS